MILENYYKANLEFRRQLWHLVFGLILVYIARFWDGAGEFYLLLGVIGLIISYFWKEGCVENKIIAFILDHVERKHHKHILPGMGMYFYLIGSGVTAIVFTRDFALFGITLLAIGDSMTHLIGRYFGIYKWPWNDYKNIEGTIFAILLCSIAGSVFVDHRVSIFVSIVVFLLESLKIPKKWWWLDDNWYIPIVGAWLASLLVNNFLI